MSVGPKRGKTYLEVCLLIAVGRGLADLLFAGGKIERALTAAFDLVISFLLSIVVLVIGPLRFWSGGAIVARWTKYAVVLLPLGMARRTIRAAVAWRVGQFEAAVAQLEGVVGVLEARYDDEKAETRRDRRLHRVRVRNVRRVLVDLYTVLARCYLHLGQLDDAMLVLVRCNKTLSLARLPDLPDLDAKSAHLVRAAISAGKMLDESGGLATMFVKTERRKSRPPRRKGSGMRRAGATKKDSSPLSRSKKNGKVIPFPTDGYPPL